MSMHRRDFLLGATAAAIAAAEAQAFAPTLLPADVSAVLGRVNNPLFRSTARLAPIATRNKGSNTSLSGAAASCLSRTWHWAFERITELQVDLPGYYVNIATGEVALGADCDAMLMAGSGATYWSGTVGGLTTFTLPGASGGMVRATITCDIPANSWYELQWWTSNAAKFGYLNTVRDTNTGGDCLISGAASSLLGTALSPGGAAQTRWVAGIYANTNRKSIGVAGDSIAVGQLDSYGGLHSSMGFIDKANDPIVPSQNTAALGDRLDKFRSAGTNRIAVLKMCDAIILEYGRNDLSGGRTLAQLQGDVQWFISAVAPVPVWTMTIPPRTLSSNGLIDPDDQTDWLVGEADTRISYNDWLRNNYVSLGLRGIIDAAAVLQHPSNARHWDTTGISDTANRLAGDVGGASGYVHPSTLTGTPRLVASGIVNPRAILAAA